MTNRKKFLTGKILIILYLLGFQIACREKTAERKPLLKTATVAGFNREFGEPFGIAVKDNFIYISDGERGKIFRAAANGKTEVFADGLDTPSQIAFDKNGNLIVADAGTNTIKKINSAGVIETIAGVENQAGFRDGAAQNALFNAPIGIAAAGDKIFVADTYNDKIRVIENGNVTTLAGSSQGFADGGGEQAKFDTPCGIAVTKQENVIVADFGNRRLRIVEPNGSVTTGAGNGKQKSVDGLLSQAEFVAPLAVTIDNSGAIYIADGNSIRVIGRKIFPLIETISAIGRGFADGNLANSRFNRPSGLATDEHGNLFVADAENQTVRVMTGENSGRAAAAEQIAKLSYTPEEFRVLQPPRWTFNPPEARRDVAGTLGEIRGELADGKNVWFHNGLDIAGNYGETARFVRDEKVLRPDAVQNFGSLRELLRLPTMGYIHIRLGRDKDGKLFADGRFQFSRDAAGKLDGVRVPRGAKFAAGEAVGTLNSLNHVHLIAGRTGAEMNALDALIFPNITDKVPPTIEQVALFDETWSPLETQTTNGRIKFNGKIRIVVRAFDQMDGGASRRKLGVYKLGYQILREDQTPLTTMKWTISFEKMPDEDFVSLVYARGSKAGYTPETIFDYIVTNEVSGEAGRENFFDAGGLENGNYILRVAAADFFGNIANRDVNIEITGNINQE